MIVNLIVGVDAKTNGIGLKGGIPWKDKEDMKWFKDMTTGNAVIMGWTTYVSLGRPLPNRLNIVISPDLDATTLYENTENVKNARSLEEAIEIAEQEKYSIAFVMGGGSIYRQYLEKDLIDTLFVDFIHTDNNLTFDTFFPFDAMHVVDEDIRVIDYENMTYDTDAWECVELPYSTAKNHFTVFHRKVTNSSSEYNTDKTYLKMLMDVIEHGQTKHTRAGETLSIFPYHAAFDLRHGLPILNTKKVFSKGCITELLWFLKGETNIKYLVDNNCHIWDDDAYRYYLQTFTPNTPEDEKPSKDWFLEQVVNQHGFQYTDDNGVKQVYTYGDLGPVYGKQWTDWNGINQINELIDKLKNNPDDRRLIVSAWNVGELKSMALPPCHYMSQWYVRDLSQAERLMYYMENKDVYGSEPNPDLDKLGVPTKGLSVMWSQRSVDSCLGFPYDLLSYSILANMIAQIVNMVPDKIYCILGDTHIYKNQLDDAYMQIVRNPYLFKPAKLKLNKRDSIYDYTHDDIQIVEYKSYPSIKYKLSVGL